MPENPLISVPMIRKVACPLDHLNDSHVTKPMVGLNARATTENLAPRILRALGVGTGSLDGRDGSRDVGGGE